MSTVASVLDRLFVPNGSFDVGKKQPKLPTKPVRVHLELAQAIEELAGNFGQSVPDFISALLLPLIPEKQLEASERLRQKAIGAKKPNRQK